MSVYDSETNSPKIHKLLNGGKIFALGEEKTLVVSSKGDGSLQFYTGCKTSETWVSDSGINFSDKADVHAWFIREYLGWDNIWSELYENASTPFIPRPQYCMPFDQNWETLPNMTMLGDAAHLMPPYAGEGVNMAMLDALELAECLLCDDFRDTRSAIAAYEKQMLARASETAQMTMEQTETMHSADGLAHMLAMFEVNE